MSKIRLFYGLDLSGEVKDTIIDFLDEYKKLSDNIKWVRPDNFHITLRFLGDTTIDKLDGLKRITDSLAIEFSRTEFSLEGVGCFPNVRYPRILWFGISGVSGYLKSLYKSLNESLLGMGIPEDTRDFKPHITVGRIKGGFSSEGLKNMLRCNANRFFIGSELKSITLFESTLSDKGAVYKGLHRSFFS